MSQLSFLIVQREHCLDALERVVGIQPADTTGRAAMTLARHCLKYVRDSQELDRLHADLCALSPDSARADAGTPALADLGGKL